MAWDDGGSENDPLVERFAQLWEEGTSSPDVFAYLALNSEASVEHRLRVLLLDQRQRWRKGRPVPLRVYLSAFPDIAARGEHVRALIEGERREQQALGARPNETASEVLGSPISDWMSQSPTMPVGAAGPSSETEEGPPGPLPEAPMDGTAGPGPHGARTTRIHSGHEATEREGTDTFELEARHHLRAEAEALRTMLRSVGFTLVRRLGTGGMGVVYEAYDQRRGELVALKTMRKVGPGPLVRFKQEFRALSDIAHPNLVNLYELFTVEDRWFFTMELIEGTDFVRYVRSGPVRRDAGPAVEAGALDARSAPAPGFDEARLRDALRQLVAGADALHQAGKLHRDIKPTNVLVTAGGRVKLLDFGLTADFDQGGRRRGVDRQVVGTLAHMSPEQMAGLAIAPASDWYSVGVVLYEALTGRLPFVGTLQEITLAKRADAPPAPESLVSGLPNDLAQLCAGLLDRAPANRPGGREILALLSGQSWNDGAGGRELVASQGRERASRIEHGRERALPLIGRSRHLRVLNESFARSREGLTASVFVFGRTGTGKTTLFRSFLEGLSAGDEAVVLSGRCYERESVPYKALDNLIDSLARHLKGLPSRQARSLLPAGLPFLARQFPVLRSVEVVVSALAASEGPDMPDPHELRRHAVAALSELFARLAENSALVLAVDDLQWGDVDSARLLSELFGAAQAPALLFVGCFRSEDAERGPFLSEVRKSGPGSSSRRHHRELAVEALTQSEARELALALLGGDDAMSLAQAHMVARESSGNPLFIDELVKHVQGGGPIEGFDAIGRLDLDEVLWARIERQPEEARRLLEVVAVSGRPLRQALAFQASELGPGGRNALASLRAARLVRQVGQARNDDDQIETYHDRVRETVIAHLTAEVLRWNHKRLVLVLATSGPVDPEIVAEHHHGAGDHARACEAYSLGGDQAAAALAFDHAARLYRRALELRTGPASSPSEWSLGRRLGDALAHAGRGAEAARAYLAAAASAPAGPAIELQRLASTQLLLSGNLDEGLALLRTLLAPAGIHMPEAPRRALVSLIWHRGLLHLRGLGFRARDGDQVSARDLARIDLCWSAVAGLSMIDPVRGASFQTRGLRLALRAGEPFRAARAMAMEAAHQATAGLPAEPHVAALLRSAEDLARRAGSHHAQGMVELVRGISAFLFGRWGPALQSLDSAELFFQNHCTGVAWERDTGHNFALLALLQLGQTAELKRRWAVLHRQALDRGDFYAVSTLTAFHMMMIQLANDERPTSEAELEAFLEPGEGRSFNLLHSSALDALVHWDLYRGAAERAEARIERAWPEYRRTLLFRIQHLRIQMLERRSRVALALAERSNDPKPYARRAASDADRLEREGQSWALAQARYVRAAVAACEDDPARAAACLAAAAELFERAEMPMHAQLMRYRIGEIEPDDKSRAARDAAESWLREQGIASPARWAAAIAPGFARVRRDSLETSF